MLIVISILFLMFSIPIDIYFLGYAYGAFSDVTPEEGAARWLFYALVTLLYYTNNSINFFMYFASGRKFRIAFLNTFFCMQPTKRALTSSSGTVVTGVQNMSMTSMTHVVHDTRRRPCHMTSSVTHDVVHVT